MYDYHKNVKAMNLLKIRLIAKCFEEKFSYTFKLFPSRVGVLHIYHTILSRESLQLSYKPLFHYCHHIKGNNIYNYFRR